jgi:hypothetical protein
MAGVSANSVTYVVGFRQQGALNAIVVEESQVAYFTKIYAAPWAEFPFTAA